MIPTILALLTAQTDPNFNCDFQRNFDETLACERAGYERAEAELEQHWQSALAAARLHDRTHGAAEPRRPVRVLVEIMRTAQSAWVTYRDAHCQAVGPEDQFDSAVQLNRFLCLRHLTEVRMRELERTTLHILNDG